MRLYNYDLLRLILVLFALISHLMLHHGWEAVLSEDVFLGIRFFTRAAMPCLIIIFGFMVYHVYYDKLIWGGVKAIYEKFANKMVFCYFAFVFLSLTGFIFGINSLVVLVGSFFLAAPATFANLYKYYFFLFPVALFFLFVIYRCGWFIAFGIVCFTWAVAELSKNLISLPYYLQHVGGLFFGIGNAWGPSVLHATVILFFGMALSHMHRVKSLLAANFLFVGILVLSCFFIFYEFLSYDFYHVVVNVVDYSSYRASNSVFYYSYSVVMFMFLLLLCSVIENILSLAGEGFLSLMTYFGRCTFTLFLIGNFYILSLPKLGASMATIILYGIVVLSLTFISTYVFESLVSKTRVWGLIVKAMVLPINHFYKSIKM